ncbi:MAG: hypothetical protein Fur0010_24540 [Bdellovibrio sp.]
MKFYVFLLSLFSLANAFATNGNRPSSFIQNIETSLPIALSTQSPSESVLEWKPEWNSGLVEEPTYQITDNAPGAIGLKCLSEFIPQDLRAAQIFAKENFIGNSFVFPAFDNEDHMDYIQRIIYRVDKTIPSFGLHLRQALDQLNIEYMNGPLRREQFNNKFSKNDLDCIMVRFSLRRTTTYGTDVFIDKDFFYHPLMTTPMRAAIIIHDMVAIHFKKQLKDDDEVVFSGIVAELLSPTFNERGLLKKLETFGYQLSDTFAYKSVSEYRPKLLSEKSAYLGMLILQKESEYRDLKEKTLNLAAQLESNFSKVQKRLSSETYVLHSLLLYPNDGIEEGLYELNNLTNTLDRLFNAHDAEINFYRSILNQVKATTKDPDQISYYNSVITEIQNMKGEQESLRSHFESLKRLNKAIISDIREKLKLRLKQVHAIEQDKFKRKEFLPDETMNIVLKKRDMIYRDVIVEIDLLK